ncbi:MAG: hybrid sensor histidine kinase/response regulator, partial [Thermodesulfovibrionales bacterium]
AAAQITSRFGIPIIFMTGYSDSATMEKASRVKPLGYFIKPIDFYRLKTTIDAAVEGRGKQSP